MNLSGVQIRTEIVSIAGVVRRCVVETVVRPPVTCAVPTRTMTSSLAMDHAVAMLAQRQEASAARLEISPSGIQSAMRPSAVDQCTVQTYHTIPLAQNSRQSAR